MPEPKSIPVRPLAGEYGLGCYSSVFGRRGIQVGAYATCKAGRNAGII